MILVCGERKTIGRSPQADFVIDEPSLSRLHAAVAMSPDGALAVEDLDSTNGVFVNGSRQKSSALAIGDGVLFGILEYRLAACARAPAGSSRPPPSRHSTPWKGSFRRFGDTTAPARK